MSLRSEQFCAADPPLFISTAGLTLLSTPSTETVTFIAELHEAFASPEDMFAVADCSCTGFDSFPSAGSFDSFPSAGSCDVECAPRALPTWSKSEVFAFDVLASADALFASVWFADAFASSAGTSFVSFAGAGNISKETLDFLRRQVVSASAATRVSSIIDCTPFTAGKCAPTAGARSSSRAGGGFT